MPETPAAPAARTAGSDLVADPFPRLDWSAGARHESVEALVAFAVKSGDDTAQWYFRRRQTKRFWGFTLRTLAMVSIAAAGVLPIVSEMGRSSPWLAVPPGVASILLVVSGVLVLLDRFAGYTSGWIRYIETGQAITARLETFRFDDQLLRLAWSEGEPDAAQAEAHIKLCRAFVGDVQALVKAETEQWAHEFRDALAQIDQATQKEPTELEAGGVLVKVAEGPTLARGWTVRVDGGPPLAARGEAKALTGLRPGMHKLTVDEVVDGAAGARGRSAETVVSVTAAAIETVTLRLGG